MNKVLISICAVLTAAVITLFVLFFGAKTEDNLKTLEIAPVENSDITNTSIVYINLDSLVSGYQMSIDLQAELQKKVNKIQKDLEKKGRALENDIADFQSKVSKGLLTNYQAQAMQQELMKREQDLQIFSEQKQRDMAEESQVTINRIMDAVQTYINKYNEENKHSLILTTTSVTNTVLAANPSLNITKAILTGLNKEYSESKK